MNEDEARRVWKQDALPPMEEPVPGLMLYLAAAVVVFFIGFMFFLLGAPYGPGM